MKRGLYSNSILDGTVCQAAGIRPVLVFVKICFSFLGCMQYKKGADCGLCT